MSSNESVYDSDSSKTALSFVVSIAYRYQHCLSHLKTDLDTGGRVFVFTSLTVTTSAVQPI